MEIRGIAGTSTDKDRHDGFHAAMDAGGNWEYVEVRGKWDEGIAQKVASDAIAVHGHFAAAMCRTERRASSVR